jgi:transcriptional regulator with XRE-family HTH domain
MALKCAASNVIHCLCIGNIRLRTNSSGRQHAAPNGSSFRGSEIALRKFSDIIERVEQIRTHLGLNKSRFSAEIGMKPQTYNNFIGSQGSKPNVELLYGIVTRFSVNPLWVFTGQGTMFLEGRGGYGGARHGAGLQVANGGTDLRLSEAAALSQELAAIEPLLRKVEDQIKRMEAGQSPLLDRVYAVMKRYAELYPAEAAEELKALLTRMEPRIK